MGGWLKYVGLVAGLLSATSWGKVLKDNPYHIYSLVRADRRFHDSRSWAKTAMRALETKAQDGAVDPALAKQILDGVALARKKEGEGRLFEYFTGGTTIAEGAANTAAELRLPQGSPTKNLSPRWLFQASIADMLNGFSRDRRGAVDHFLAGQRTIDVFLSDNSISEFHKWFLEGLAAYWRADLEKAPKGDSFAFIRNLLGESMQPLVWGYMKKLGRPTSGILAQAFPDVVVDELSGREVLAGASAKGHGPLTSFVAGVYFAPIFDDWIAGGRAWAELEKKGYTPGRGFFMVGDSKAIEAQNEENLERFLQTLAVYGTNISRNEAERLLRMPQKRVLLELEDGTLVTPGAALETQPDRTLKVVLLFDSEEPGEAELASSRGIIDQKRIVHVWGENDR